MWLSVAERKSGIEGGKKGYSVQEREGGRKGRKGKRKEGGGERMPREFGIIHR